MTQDRPAGFRDHFSGHAEAYARARPRYPSDLFDFLARRAPHTRLAWDCATGNGQAACSLARYFGRVIATDASAEQVARAQAAPGVDYRVALAEASGLPDRSADLVTVAQALHWFDIPSFFREAARVLVPDGILAVWCYGFCRVAADCDAVIDALYEELSPYWPPERAHIETGYRDIELPFEPVDCPEFAMTADWTADELLAYLDTWSAVQHCRRATGRDPVGEAAAALRAGWGEGRRAVRWPLTVKAARKDRPGD